MQARGVGVGGWSRDSHRKRSSPSRLSKGMVKCKSPIGDQRGGQMVLNRIEPADQVFNEKKKKQRALDRSLIRILNCTRRHNHLQVHYNKIP